MTAGEVGSRPAAPRPCQLAACDWQVFLSLPRVRPLRPPPLFPRTIIVAAHLVAPLPLPLIPANG